MVFGKVPRELRSAHELGTPSSLSQSLLQICLQIDNNTSAVTLEDVSNLLFEGNCPFALAFNTSVKSYLNSFEVLHWLAYGAVDPKQYLELHPNVERKELRCGEMWKGTHVAYRCATCGISENSCMCVACFDEEQHKGHDYRVYSSAVGGCCDCGDGDAWRPEGFCKRHSPTAVAAIELDSTIVNLSTKACTIAAYHMFRSLHRMFQRGLTKPQDAKSPASFQVLKCVEFFTTMANMQRETRLGVCNAFSTRLHSSFAALANATSGTIYLPTFTLTEVLLNVCCFLPHGLCKDTEMLLLKLIMEPSYKPGFQSDFVRYYAKFLQVARECNQNQLRTPPAALTSASRIAIRANLEAVYGTATPREMFESACQVLDGLYCQLFHNEEVSIEFAPQVLLAAFGQLALPLSPLKYGFYSRTFSEIHSLLAFPSICRIVVRDEALFHALLVLLQSAEKAVPEIQNETDIFPFYVLLEQFILTPVCLALEEEHLRFDVLEQYALALPKLPRSIHIPFTRFYLRCCTTTAADAVHRCANALQEMFLFEHAKNASMGTYLAARYKRAFLQIDMQCLAKHNFLEQHGEEFVWQEREYELRVLGALAMLQQRPKQEDDLKRRLIHVLASKQPCVFSEIDLECEVSEDIVSRLLEEVATQSKHTSPIQFTLKPEYWKQVEFGGFYLAWTLKDEEEAMQAYRKHFKLTNEAVFPVADRFLQRATTMHAPSARLTELCESVLRTGDVRCKTMALLIHMLYHGKPIDVSSSLSEWSLEGVCKNLYAAGETKPEQEEEASASATPQPQNPAQAKALKALAKKQRNFALQMQQLEEAEHGSSSQNDEACCVLCKDSGDEPLHLLILRKDTCAAQNREMVYWQGQSKGVAVSLMDKHIPTDASIHATSVHDDAGTQRTFWQSRFFAKLQSARAQWSNTHVESTVLHTCNHVVHETCLNTYRTSLAERQAKREHFEGEQVIVLELGEVVCPVCRRVANDVMPLSSRAVDFPVSSIPFDEWFTFRFSPVKQQPTTHFERPIAKSKAQFDSFVKRFDCLAELVVAQLEVDSLALPELFALCMENRTCGREHWNHVLQKRFSGEGRECALHTDLIVVFVEWLFVDDHVDLEHMYNVLLPFARAQDLLIDSLALANSDDDDDDETSLFEDDNEDELLGALELLKQQIPAHRTLTIDVTLAAKALMEDLDGAKSEFVELVKRLVRLYAFPRRTHSRESFVDRFTRLCETLTGRQFNPSTETSPRMHDLLERALHGFFREASKSWDESKCDASMVRFVDTANQLHVWSLLPPVFTRDISTLIALPQEYSSLTVAFLGRQCVCIKCKTKPDNPALCLSCGMMLCLRSTCCHEGAYGPITSDMDEFLLDEVFTHAQRTCSRGGKTSSSVFLVLKNGAVLVVLSEARFNLFGTLYLDAHQEEDLFLSRGKPLLLNADKLEKLEQLQVSQRWFHDSKILESTRVLAFHQ